MRALQNENCNNTDLNLVIELVLDNWNTSKKRDIIPFGVPQ